MGRAACGALRRHHPLPLLSRSPLPPHPPRAPPTPGPLPTWGLWLRPQLTCLPPLAPCGPPGSPPPPPLVCLVQPWLWTHPPCTVWVPRRMVAWHQPWAPWTARNPHWVLLLATAQVPPSPLPPPHPLLCFTGWHPWTRPVACSWVRWRAQGLLQGPLQGPPLHPLHPLRCLKAGRRSPRCPRRPAQGWLPRPWRQWRVPWRPPLLLWVLLVVHPGQGPRVLGLVPRQGLRWTRPCPALRTCPAPLCGPATPRTRAPTATCCATAVEARLRSPNGVTTVETVAV